MTAPFLVVVVLAIDKAGLVPSRRRSGAEQRAAEARQRHVAPAGRLPMAGAEFAEIANGARAFPAGHSDGSRRGGSGGRGGCRSFRLGPVVSQIVSCSGRGSSPVAQSSAAAQSGVYFLSSYGRASKSELPGARFARLSAGPKVGIHVATQVFCRRIWGSAQRLRYWMHFGADDTRARSDRAR